MGLVRQRREGLSLAKIFKLSQLSIIGMAITRIFSTFASTGQRVSSFVQDALEPTEEQFFIKKTSGRRFVTPERLEDVWFPDTIDEAVRLAPKHASKEATHFDVLPQPFEYEGSTYTQYIVRYYKL